MSKAGPKGFPRTVSSSSASSSGAGVTRGIITGNHHQQAFQPTTNNVNIDYEERDDGTYVVQHHHSDEIIPIVDHRYHDDAAAQLAAEVAAAQAEADSIGAEGGESGDAIEINVIDDASFSVNEEQQQHAAGLAAGASNGTVEAAGGALSLEDAYNILTGIGYNGKQSLHAPEARIYPRAGQVYLFFFTADKKPYKRLRINDGYIWHNKSRAFHPRNNPKMVRVTYRTSGLKPNNNIDDEDDPNDSSNNGCLDVTIRKAYWMAVAEENNEDAVVLIEYINDAPAAATSNGAASGRTKLDAASITPTEQSSPTPTKLDTFNTPTKNAANNTVAGGTSQQQQQQQQPTNKVLVEPSPDSAHTARPPILPRKRLYDHGSTIVSLNASAVGPSMLIPSTANVQTRQQMIEQVQDALKYVQEYKDFIWDLEGNLRSIVRDLSELAQEEITDEGGG